MRNRGCSRRASFGTFRARTTPAFPSHRPLNAIIALEKKKTKHASCGANRTCETRGKACSIRSYRSCAGIDLYAPTAYLKQVSVSKCQRLSPATTRTVRRVVVACESTLPIRWGKKKKKALFSTGEAVRESLLAIRSSFHHYASGRGDYDFTVSHRLDSKSACRLKNKRVMKRSEQAEPAINVAEPRARKSNTPKCSVYGRRSHDYRQQ